MSGNRETLEAYRIDVYGNERPDYDLCLSALNDQATRARELFEAAAFPDEMGA